MTSMENMHTYVVYKGVELGQLDELYIPYFYRLTLAS